MNSVDTSVIDQDIMDLFTDLIKMRRHIHAHPEVGPVQPETVAYVKEQFDGMEHVNIIEGEPTAGVVVDISGNSSGPTIAFRADMDALDISETTTETHFPNQMNFRSKYDNKMHACGHDLHTAILIGFGKIIHQHRDRLKGKIRLLFQPGEEGYAGGKQMVKAGYLDDVLTVFALHCWPDLAVGQVGFRDGPFFASIDYFTVTISGIGGHGAAPEKASDQLLAMSRIINDLQTIVSRRISGLDHAVLSVCYANAGSYDAPAVIPATAQFRGSIRAFSSAIQDTVEAEFKNICRHSASSVHPDCNVAIEYKRVYPQTVNDSRLTRKVAEVFSRFIKKDNLFTDYKPTMGGEDFSFMTEKVPGVLFLVGGSLPENLSDKTVFLHNPSFDVDERLILFGVQAFKSLAFELLS
ncbi:MAG: amidohydrolase [Deltaproteobacteria bacterium]|nr:amidohydrolase [Candidatus Anaeroferrophillus wilburensis]MBN2889817.1 amidohydrolase [Deltaproteobacteria bacterium]